MARVPSLNDLIDDCLLHIFNYFEIDHLLTLSTVCTRWNYLIQTTKFLKKITITSANYRNICLENVKSAKFQNVLLEREFFPTLMNFMIPDFTNNLTHLEITFLPTSNTIKHLRSIKLPSITLTLCNPQHIHSYSNFWDNNHELRRLKVHLVYGGYLCLRKLPDTLTTFVASNVHMDADCLRHCTRLTCVKIKDYASNFNFPLLTLKTLKLGYSKFLPSVTKLEHFTYTNNTLPQNMIEFLAECHSTLEYFNVPHFHFSDKRYVFPQLKDITVDEISEGSFPNLKNLTLCSYNTSHSFRDLEYLNLQHCNLDFETHLKKFSKLKTFEFSNDNEFYTPRFLRHINCGLKELTIFNIVDLRVNLTKFVELRHLLIKTYFENDVTISLPKSLNRMTVIGYFKMNLKKPVNFTELEIKVFNEKCLDAVTLRRCLPNLRILKLFVLLWDPVTTIRKILKVLKNYKTNNLFAIYVQPCGKPYENTFRQACPKLEIFNYSWS